MYSVRSLRQFIGERLTAAAEEIFTEFEKTIEEELDRQRRLLDFTWKQKKTHTTELARYNIRDGDEDLSQQELFNQHWKFRVDQVEPEHAPIKEELEEVQLLQKWEADTIMVMPASDESDMDQVFSQNSPVADYQDQEEINYGNLEAHTSEERNPKKTHKDTRSEGEDVDPVSESCELRHRNSHNIKEVLPDQQLFSWDGDFKLDQEEPEHPHTKEEIEEYEHLKPVADMGMTAPTSDKCQQTQPKQEPSMEQVLPQVAEDQDQEEKHRTNQSPGSTSNEGPNPNKRQDGTTSDDDISIHSGELCPCKVCGKRVLGHYLLDHMRSHAGEKPFSCEICGKGFTHAESLSNHKRVHKAQKPFSCEVCQRGFTQACSLRIHMRVHTGEKPYSCKTCGKCFSHSSNLTHHMRSHTGEKPFSCDICGKSFTQAGSLNTHKRVHTGEKPYTCETCGKCFYIQSHLTCHMRTHTGEKPYSCQICGKCFSQFGNLTCHMQTHTGNKPYSCDICTKAFARVNHLTIHKRCHASMKPFSCGICGRGFMEAANLNAHMVIHSGAAPYTCEICTKSFREVHQLTIHMRTHTGERPFPCKLCDKSYTQASSLLRHMKQHAGASALG